MEADLKPQPQKVPTSPLQIQNTTAAQAVVDCGKWRKQKFFRKATVEDVTACINAGADINARECHMQRQKNKHNLRFFLTVAVTMVVLAVPERIMAQTPSVSSVWVPVCERTPQVRDAIVRLAKFKHCRSMTRANVAGLRGQLHMERLGSSSSPHIYELKPGDFSGLEKLEGIVILRHRLTSLPASAFSGLTSLRRLYVAATLLQTLPVDIFPELPSLERLELPSNLLTSLPERGFSGLTLGSLKYLELSNNRITNIPANAFSGQASLEYLGLDRNELTSLPPGLFSGMTRLRNLGVGTIQRNGLPAAVLSGLTSLEELGLSVNGPLPARIFSGLTSLRELRLDIGHLTSLPADLFVTTGLKSLGSLDELWLAGAQLTHVPKDIFSGMTSLQQIRINRTQLTDLPARIFSGLTSLQGVHLENNQLTSLPARIFSGLTSLKIVDVAKNQLTSLPARIFSGLTSLSIGSVRAFDNPGSPFPISVSLRLVGKGEIRVAVNHDLPGGSNSELRVDNGFFDDGSTWIRVSIPAGSLESETIRVSPTPGASSPTVVHLRSFEINNSPFIQTSRSFKLVLSGPIIVFGLPTTPGKNLITFVPVILTAGGRNNSFFTSEMTLTNRSAEPAVLNYTYTSHPGGKTNTATEMLGALQQKIAPNAIDYLRSLEVPIPETGNQIGTLSVQVSGSSQVGVMVRTATAVPNGRAGLAYPGILVSEGFQEEAVYLCGLRQNQQDRSNVAFQNMGAEGEITLRTTVFSGEAADSSARMLDDVTLGPGEFHQHNAVLRELGSPAQGYVKVERVAGEAPFYAYGVINDQANSDGSFVFPVTESSLTGVTGQTLPVIVETRSFSSELMLTNFSRVTKIIGFWFVADALQTVDHTAKFSVSLKAGEQILYSDVVNVLRQHRVSGIGPAGPVFAGALFAAEVRGEDLSGVVIGARTGSPGGGGRYGVFYNAVPRGAGFTDSAWVDALQQNEENRSNLALVNTGEVDDSASVFSLDIYDGETMNLVKTVTTKSIPAQRWRQINGILLNHAPGTKQGYVHIRRTSGNNPFLAYGVVNDGGIPRQRSDDGAYIPAR